MSNEKIPNANERGIIKRYINAMRNSLARAISKLAEKIGTDTKNSNDSEAEQSDFDESRRNFLRGSAFLIASVSSPSSVNMLGTNKITGLNLAPNELKYLLGLAELNERTGTGLQNVLYSLTDKRSVFDDIKALLTFENNLATSVDLATWEQWKTENLNQLSGSWKFILERIYPDLPLDKLGNPKVLDALRSLGLDINKEDLNKISKFDTLGKLQDSLRQNLLEVFKVVVDQYKTNPNSELLKMKVSEIDKIFKEYWDFRYWVSNNEGLDFLNDISRIAIEIKVKNGSQLSTDDLQNLREMNVDTIEISKNSILSNNYSKARNFVRSSLGKGAKRFSLHAFGSSKARSIENKKHTEFYKEFAEIQKGSPSGFVKVVVYYD